MSTNGQTPIQIQPQILLQQVQANPSGLLAKALGIEPDGSQILTTFLATWRQPCCYGFSEDEHSRFENPSPWPIILNQYGIRDDLKEFIEELNEKMGETEVPLAHIGNPIGKTHP